MEDVKETKRGPRGQKAAGVAEGVKEAPVTTETAAPAVFNPLRKERVIVRLIKKHRGFVDDPKSPFYEGMAPNSENRLVVPRLRNGSLKNVLTNEEKTFFEKTLGLPENALSIYKTENNYWITSTPNCINSVRLTKRDLILDLSVPADYIRYKILLANDDIVCPNIGDQNNKNTYMYVLINDRQEANTLNKKVNTKLHVFEMFARYSEDADKLRAICWLCDGRKVSKSTLLEVLKAKVMDFIENNMTKAANIFDDPLLNYKILIYNAVENGVIADRNNIFYDRETGNALCKEYEIANLNTAAAYLADVSNGEYAFNIQKRTYK